MAAGCEGVISAEDLDTCEIEVTVVTGFEAQAKDEIREKLNVSSTSARGKVNFHIPVKNCKKVLELSSVDNATVILNHYPDFQFADDPERIMDQLRALVPGIDWELGLRVWREFFSFHLPISSHPKSSVKEQSSPEASQSTTEINLQDSQKIEPHEPELPSDQLQETTCQQHSSKEQSVSDEPDLKRSKETSWDQNLPAFRVTCYRTGSHVFQSPDAAANFGGEINNYFGWNVSMKHFDIEVILNIDHDHVYVSLALTRQSLHRRNLTSFGPTTLRPTIAYNMLRFAQIKGGEVVCDPMCGGGSIPIEAALNWPRAIHICGDIHDQACPRTKANIDALNTKRLESGLKTLPLTVFRWDVCKLPLQNETVDLFITDLPFGKRSGSKVRNFHFYPQILMEMARVCKTETGRACLLTQDKKNLVKSLMHIESLWRRGPTIGINIGGLAAGVFLLHRTTRKYMTKEELNEDRQLREEHKQQRQAKYQQRQQQQQQHADDSA